MGHPVAGLCQRPSGYISRGAFIFLNKLFFERYLMNIYTSYFYQVRFMQPFDIPLSTAVWDPKWYHDFKGHEHIFVDKRGVINGVRFAMFAPGASCDGLCCGIDDCRHGNPEDCLFLKAYREQLDRVDYTGVMLILSSLGKELQEHYSFEHEPNFIFLVHEAPNNPCSERRVIQEWFASYGLPVREWRDHTV